MVVGDDYVHAQGPGEGDLLQVGDAAVHGDDQGDALFRQGGEGAAVEGVPLPNPVGHVGVTRPPGAGSR